MEETSKEEKGAARLGVRNVSLSYILRGGGLSVLPFMAVRYAKRFGERSR